MRRVVVGEGLIFVEFGSSEVPNVYPNIFSIALHFIP
jgi:hypothetical protein